MWLACRVPPGGSKWRPGLRNQSGAVLLEVVLALVLFVGAAAVLSSGLSSSLDTLERLRLNNRAADLAVTVLSELQMGIKTWAANGPQPFEQALEGWTWEVSTVPVQSQMEDDGPFRRVEIIIRHAEPELIYRLSQTLLVADADAAGRFEPGDAHALNDRTE